jgi:hypothetical protein
LRLRTVVEVGTTTLASQMPAAVAETNEGRFLRKSRRGNSSASQKNVERIACAAAQRLAAATAIARLSRCRQASVAANAMTTAYACTASVRSNGV